VNVTKIAYRSQQWLYGEIKILSSHIGKRALKRLNTVLDYYRTERLFAKQIVQCGPCALNFVRVLRNVGTRLRSKVIAKVCLILFAHFLGSRFLAMFRVAHIVLDAHFANVQLRPAFLAGIKAAQRQTQQRERFAAAPAN